MGQFDFDGHAGNIDDVPSQFRKLDGKRVCIEGEIYDPTEGGDITRWQVVYAIETSGRHPPRVQERVFCTAPPGKAFKRGDGSHKIFGTLHVAVKRGVYADGALARVEEIYHLDVDGVEREGEDSR